MTQNHKYSPPQTLRQTMLHLAFILFCAGAMALTGWWLQRNRSETSLAFEDQSLYGSNENVRRMSLAFNGIVADWYWMRSVQYVGRKVLRSHETGAQLQLDDLRNLNLKLLYPLLDRCTSLDPQFLAAYEYGGIVLPAVDPDAAIKLLQKGISNNPQEWRLYHQLGYIYWKRKDFPNASAMYNAGGAIAGAPSWLEAMSARMSAEGGSRDTARELYRRLYEEAEDTGIKQMAELRLAEVDSFEERDAIRQALKVFRERANRCPSDWRELQTELRVARLPNGKPLVFNAAGEPLDTTDAPYKLTNNGCDVGLGPATKLPLQEY